MIAVGISSICYCIGSSLHLFVEHSRISIVITDYKEENFHAVRRVNEGLEHIPDSRNMIILEGGLSKCVNNISKKKSPKKLRRTYGMPKMEAIGVGPTTGWKREELEGRFIIRRDWFDLTDPSLI